MMAEDTCCDRNLIKLHDRISFCLRAKMWEKVGRMSAIGILKSFPEHQLELQYVTNQKPRQTSVNEPYYRWWEPAPAAVPY